ncbi:MAG: RsbRD N-terminal domain-containing protein [Acidobacteriota bacterium]|jgi:hypothetical protein
MPSFDSIVDAWFLKSIEIYPPAVRDTLIRTTDQFRNPLAFNLRQSLETLVHQVADRMNPEAVNKALDGIVRLRAVQECSPSEAVSFAARLDEVIREQQAETLFPNLKQHIGQLTECALQQYNSCKEEILQIRSRSQRRLRPLEPWMRQSL